MKFGFIVLGVLALGVVIAVGIEMRRRAGGKCADNRTSPMRDKRSLSDAEIINSMPKDIKDKYKMLDVPSDARITAEWLKEELFGDILCCDSEAMNRICRHIIVSSNGRYRAAADVGDKFDSNYMSEMDVVSGDHFVKRIKLCGIIDASSGKVLLKAIVE